MAFHYHRDDLKVVDDATGVEIFRKGRGELDLWRFVFVDPRTAIRTFWRAGEFPFYAAPVHRTVYVEDAAGKRPSGMTLEGFKINKTQLRTSFVKYTGGNSEKFASVCDLVSEGLQEWLRNRGGAKDPVITFD